MDQAFAAVWHMLRTDKPFRDYANDTQLKMAIGKKLLNLVVDGVTDPLSGSEISPWRACFCHVVDSRAVPPRCAPEETRLNTTGDSHDHTYCYHQLFFLGIAIVVAPIGAGHVASASSVVRHKGKRRRMTQSRPSDPTNPLTAGSAPQLLQAFLTILRVELALTLARPMV